MFERYTETARRAIFFARAQSIFRKAPAISVQDLLLGLTREKKSRANYISELKKSRRRVSRSLRRCPAPATSRFLPHPSKTTTSLGGRCQEGVVVRRSGSAPRPGVLD